MNRGRHPKKKKTDDTYTEFLILVRFHICKFVIPNITKTTCVTLRITVYHKLPMNISDSSTIYVGIRTANQFFQKDCDAVIQKISRIMRNVPKRFAVQIRDEYSHQISLYSDQVDTPLMNSWAYEQRKA